MLGRTHGAVDVHEQTVVHDGGIKALRQQSSEEGVCELRGLCVASARVGAGVAHGRQPHAHESRQIGVAVVAVRQRLDRLRPNVNLARPCASRTA